jgi:hypothetical protein
MRGGRVRAYRVALKHVIILLLLLLRWHLLCGEACAAVSVWDGHVLRKAHACMFMQRAQL